MTPHLIRSELDHARILAEETAKLKWCLPEIANAHTHGMEVMGPASRGARPVQVNPASIGPAYFGPFDPSAPNAIGSNQIQTGALPPTGAPPLPIPAPPEGEALN